MPPQMRRQVSDGSEGDGRPSQGGEQGERQQPGSGDMPPFDPRHMWPYGPPPGKEKKTKPLPPLA